MSEPEDFVICRICGKKFQQITNSHLKKHTMILEEYKKEFPETPMTSWKTRKKQSAVTTGRIVSEKTKAKMSVTWTKQWKDPVFRANRVSRIGKNNPMYGKTFTHTEETKINHSEYMTERWKDQEYRDKHSGKNHPMYGKTFTHTKEIRDKNRTTTTELWKDPKYIDKHTGENNANYGKIGENAPNYIDGRSFLPYCHFFNKPLKEQVRNRWGRVCALTDLMRSTLGSDAGLDDFEGHEIFSEKRLAVHHIYGNKMAGCDSTELSLIPLQGSYNSKKFDGLKLENHPFYITLFMLKDLERRSREQRINGG